MTDLTPVSSLDDVIQLETSDLGLAGPGGPLNLQAQSLLNRTKFLQDALVALQDFDADLQDPLGALTGSALLGHRMRTARDQLDSICVTPENFGAIGDGVADDTAAIQAGLDFCASFNGSLFDTPAKTYSITSVKVKNGIRVLDMTKGTIKPTNACLDLNTAAIKFDGPNLYAGTAVRNAVISLRIDMSAGGVMPTACDGVSDNTFKNCRITGYVDHPTLNHYGLLFWYGSNRNKLYNNSIVGVTNPTMRGLLIDFIGESDPFGNYFDGAGVTTRPITPCLDNIIFGNELQAGSYAINQLGCENTIIANNVCKGQNHRAIYMANSCYFSIVANNQLLDFNSSAVLLGYGCDQNIVVGNTCKRDVGVWAAGTGEAVININTGAQRNIIADNRCFADTNYGIYLACNTSFNSILNNEVRGYYLAGIAMESDWEAIADKPAGALYSRPNYALPSTVSPGATQWSFNNLESNVIKGNTIREGATGRSVAAIYVAQVNSNTNLSTIKNVIEDNEVFGNSDMAHYIYIFEETSGRSVNNKLGSNKFTDTSGVPSASKIFLSRGRQHFNYSVGNDVIDTGIVTTTDGDTTPTVGIGRELRFGNTGATSVTAFDDGFVGQVVRFRLDANTTIVHNSAIIRTANSANISGRNTNDFVDFELVTGDVWIEVNRSFSLALTGQATYDPPSLVDGAGATTTVTVTGAALGDIATGSFSLDLQGIMVTYYVSATNTVSARFQNETTGTIDLASGTLRARVMRS